MIRIKSLASGSAGNCYIVSDGKTSLLIEAGIPIKKISKGIGFKLASEVDGCFITHEHMDHSKSARDIMTAGIDVYTSQGTIEALELAGHRIHHIKSKHLFSISTWAIMPFDIQHDAAEPLGFLLQSQETKEKLVYITDSYYSRYKFRNLSYIMIEANYSMDILNENIRTGKIPAVMKNRLLQSHFSLENMKGFLKANDLSQVKEIWLLHLSDRNSNEELFKREIQELTGKPVYVAGG
jgi:phosphoribosyl 1,2-cyclic phosphodiesterase